MPDSESSKEDNMTTFKGLNWLLLGATIVLGGCDSKGDDTGDDYDTTPSNNDGEGSGSDEDILTRVQRIADASVLFFILPDIF